MKIGMARFPVNTADLMDGAVTNAKVNATAAIAASKIANTAETQNNKNAVSGYVGLDANSRMAQAQQFLFTRTGITIVKDTVYQNDTGRPYLIAAIVYSATAQQIHLIFGPSNPPTENTDTYVDGGPGWPGLCFALVSPLEYWKITSAGVLTFATTYRIGL